MNSGSNSFTWVALDDGSFTLQEVESGHWMHSRIGAFKEAQKVYLDPSRFRERLQARQTDDPPFVVWDVGMGVATNALSVVRAIREFHRVAPECEWPPIQIESFESKPEGLELALRDPGRLGLIPEESQMLHDLLRHRRVERPELKLNWVLHSGDFRENLSKATTPDWILYDFYSPSSIPELWNLKLFQAIYARLSSRSKDLQERDPVWLITYSASTRVRSALLLAGFYVARGEATGAKSETTLATTALVPSLRYLKKEWLTRFQTQNASVPFGMEETEGDRSKLRELLSSHPQFI